MKKRAVGVIRVSEAKGREGDSFVSPVDQRNRILEFCEREGLQLIETEPEINVSGGAPLSQRKALRRGVEAIEAGEAEVLLVGYLDRLVRKVTVQHEIVQRVEDAGGEVRAVDYGKLSHETAAERLKGTFMGAVHEYVREQAKERTADAQADAVARGIPPFAHVPPGLKREVVGHDKKGKPKLGPFVVDPDVAPLMLEAFKMRDAGRAYNDIRRFLKDQGIVRSYHAIAELLANRVYLGELHFGELQNLEAHEAIIPRDLFDRVQRTKGTRGRLAKSERLLARLGVLRCHEGARMVGSVKKRGDRRYHYYRCPANNDCSHRVSISAPVAERVAEEAVKAALADVEGRASVVENVRRAEADLEAKQSKLDDAITALADLAGEPASQQTLAVLKHARDEAQAVVDQLLTNGAGQELIVTTGDWDRLDLDEKRDLIKATVEAIYVSPEGKEAERLEVHLYSA